MINSSEAPPKPFAYFSLVTVKCAEQAMFKLPGLRGLSRACKEVKDTGKHVIIPTDQENNINIKRNKDTR